METTIQGLGLKAEMVATTETIKPQTSNPNTVVSFDPAIQIVFLIFP